MEHLSNLWSLILNAHQTAVQAIAQPYRAEFERLRGRFQTDNPAIVGHFVYLVENFDPNHFSVEAYQRRDPFDHPQVVADFLKQAADLRWLEPTGDDVYRITDQGHAIRNLRWRISNPLFADQTPLPAADMEYLLAKLQHFVVATAASPRPPNKWSLKTRLRHSLQPPPGSAPLYWFVHYRMDLGAYRDDAHLATWRDVHQTTPLAWEMLTLLWSDQADSAETLAQQLGRRGFPPADHTAALTDLQQRGWITQEGDGRCQLTAEGQSVRDTAETLTNTYFCSPWAISNKHESQRLRHALTALSG